MMHPKAIITREKIAVIHVAKTQLGLTEDEYRAALSSVGVGSSKELTNAKFNVVMKHFETLGFVGKNHKRAQSGKSGQKEKVKAMMGVMGVTDAYINAIVKTMFDLNHWTWCTGDQMRRLIAALNYNIQRMERKRGDSCQLP